MLNSNLQEDQGAALIIVTASLMFMMGLSAIVVDIGNAMGERRQAQSAVDFGVLAALTGAKGPNPEDAGATEAINIVDANLPGRDLEAWSTCEDPSRPLEYSRVSWTKCISFTSNFERARVHLPDDRVGTTFARVLGTNEIVVAAAAEAEQLLQISSDVLPFTIAGDGCLFSNQAPQTVPPCDGPSDGNFGYLDVALYGNSEKGTPQTCELGNGNDRVAINTAKGSDHNMIEYDGGTPLNDHDECTNRSEDIDELEVKTGSASGGITDGLIDGSPSSINGQSVTPSPGRLLYDASVSTGSATVRGDVLDDTPLWQFLNGNGPASCTTPTPSTLSEMQDCLNAWDPSAHSDIFEKGLELHPRFAAVPVFSIYPADPTAGGSTAYTIDHFAPIFLETIYQGCNANRCKTVFSPGETGGSSDCPDPIEPDTINCGHDEGGSNTIEGLTSLVLKVGMLHPDTQEFFPGTLQGRELLLLK